MKHLDLSNNVIDHVDRKPGGSCLVNLETIDLHNNELEEIVTLDSYRTPSLKYVNLAENRLKCAPDVADMDLNKLDLSNNRISSFDLSLIYVKEVIDLSKNPLKHFTNVYNRVFSSLSTDLPESIILTDVMGMIDFDDGIFEMTDHCEDVQDSTPPSQQFFQRLIVKIHLAYPKLLNWNCSCNQYHFQKYFDCLDPNDGITPLPSCQLQSTSCVHSCGNLSNLNVMKIKPRFCSLDPSDTSVLPVLVLFPECDLLEVRKN